MEINHWTIFTKSNIARIVKAVPPSHKWMREKLNVSGLKSQVRIKWKRLLLSRKVELICKNYVWIARKISFSELANNASQQVSALLCNWNHAMISNGESLFRPKMCLCCCWFVTFVAIFTLGTQQSAISIFIDPEKLWRLPNGRLACLALPIKHTLRWPLLLNTTSQCMCAHESASTNTRGGQFFWGPLQCISCILCPEPFYLFRVWLVSGGLANQSFRMEMPGACLSNTDKSDAKTFAF